MWISAIIIKIIELHVYFLLFNIFRYSNNRLDSADSFKAHERRES